MEEWKIRIKEFLSVKKNMAIVGGVLVVVVVGLLTLGLADSGEKETSNTNETETTDVSDEIVLADTGIVELNDVKYEYDVKTKTVKMLKNSTPFEKKVIPSTVEIGGESFTVVELGEGVLENDTNVREVVIPDTVTQIGKGAFKNCVHLSNVQLPSEIEVLEESVFEGCWDLEMITIPSSVKEIKSRAFYDCNKLIDVIVLGDISKLGNEAFASCNQLVWVELAEGASVAKNAFEGTRYGQFIYETASIDGFKYSYMRGKKDVSIRAWEGGEQAHIEVPSQVIINNVEYTVTGFHPESSWIGIFEDASWLVSIKIPDTITTLGGEGNFRGCTNLEEVELSNNITWLGEETFKGCEKLKKVNIPTELIEIKSRAFENCVALENIEVPDGVTKWGDSVFSGCTSLKEFRFPNGLDAVPKSVLYGCTALETVVLPETVKVIGVSAFENCTNLKNINIPASVVTVLRHSFAGCTSLGNITFPENALVEEEVFTTEVVEQADNNWVELTHEELKYIVDYEKGIAHVVGIVLANYMSSDIVVPSELRIDGVTVYVTEIRAEAFRNREDILTVTVSEGITHIHDKAFEKCVSLRSVKLPSSLTEIGDRAFAGCSSLMKVEMPGNPTMGFDVFVDCHETMTMY